MVRRVWHRQALWGAVTAMALVSARPAPGDVPQGPARAQGDVSPLPVLGRAPEFRLHSLEGPRVGLQDLRGKVVLLALMCAICSDEPAEVVAGFARLQTELKGRGLFGQRVVLVFIARHPEWDLRAALRAFAGRLGADPFGWVILTGSPAATARLRVAFAGLAAHPGGSPGGDVKGQVFLVDYAGRVRRVYHAPAFDPDAVLKEIQLLL